jgi:hypothetical protein
MPGALGLTVALKTTDWVGDTEVGGGRCVVVEVRDRYSSDEGGDCDTGVKGSVLDEGGEEDMGVDEREDGC